MKKLFIWALAFGFCWQSFAQSSLPTTAPASLSEIRVNPVAQKYADLIKPDDARKHLTILASDEFEGRETGKPGADKAANYISSEFKKLGLKAPVGNSYFQNVPLLERSFVVGSFLVNNTPLSNWKDFYFSGNQATETTLSAKEIVFVGYGISNQAYDDLANVDLKGKIVMVIGTGEPTKDGISAITKTQDRSIWSLDRTMRLRFIQNKLPALILSVDPLLASMLPINGGKGPKPRLTIKVDEIGPMQPTAPVVNITDSIANIFLKSLGKTFAALKAEIDNSFTPKTQTVKADFSTQFGPKATDVHAVNVLGFLEGSDLKDEVLVFSAHYDHIGINPNNPADQINNGADDDGSGTTAVLEIARAFSNAKKEGNGPRRSILFLGNVGEEAGLLGSEWYTDNPIFPLENTITDLNIDMIGRVDPDHAADPNYCYLVGSDKLSSELHKISEEVNAAYTRLKIDYKYNDPKDPEQIYYRSDHYNFAKHNVPIIFYFNGIHADYHKPSDEVSKINFDLLVKRAQLVFYTGWELANRDKKPAVDSSTSNINNIRR